MATPSLRICVPIGKFSRSTVVDGQTPGAELEGTTLSAQADDLLKSYQAGPLSAQDMKGIRELLRECIDEYGLRLVGEDKWAKYHECRDIRLYAYDLLEGNDMGIFEDDDALEDLVKGYKARKASEGGAPPTDEIHLDVWMSNARAKINNAGKYIGAKANNLGKDLGAMINKSKSSPSLGMPEGLGGSVVKPPVFAGPGL
ncbi:MAG: hypothetical protein M1816_003620 [Peltula sp. TS41687]|nr:MAG: hypothetical protein M1816_003620 [Peltula sp. TS41687]